MRNTTPMFPGFHLQTLRRKPRSAQQKLAGKMALLRQKSFKQIGVIHRGQVQHLNFRVPQGSGSTSKLSKPAVLAVKGSDLTFYFS